jgi:hypothetical protein
LIANVSWFHGGHIKHRNILCVVKQGKTDFVSLNL